MAAARPSVQSVLRLANDGLRFTVTATSPKAAGFTASTVHTDGRDAQWGDLKGMTQMAEFYAAYQSLDEDEKGELDRLEQSLRRLPEEQGGLTGYRTTSSTLAEYIFDGFKAYLFDEHGDIRKDKLKELKHGQGKNAALAAFFSCPEIYALLNPQQLLEKVIKSSALEDGFETEEIQAVFLFIMAAYGNSAPGQEDEQTRADKIISGAFLSLANTANPLVANAEKPGDPLGKKQQERLATAVVSLAMTRSHGKLRKKTVVRIAAAANYQPEQGRKAKIERILKRLLHAVAKRIGMTPAFWAVTDDLLEDIARETEERQREYDRDLQIGYHGHIRKTERDQRDPAAIANVEASIEETGVSPVQGFEIINGRIDKTPRDKLIPRSRPARFEKQTGEIYSKTIRRVLAAASQRGMQIPQIEAIIFRQREMHRLEKEFKYHPPYDGSSGYAWGRRLDPEEPDAFFLDGHNIPEDEWPKDVPEGIDWYLYHDLAQRRAFEDPYYNFPAFPFIHIRRDLLFARKLEDLHRDGRLSHAELQRRHAFIFGSLTREIYRTQENPGGPKIDKPYGPETVEIDPATQEPRTDSKGRTIPITIQREALEAEMGGLEVIFAEFNDACFNTGLDLPTLDIVAAATGLSIAQLSNISVMLGETLQITLPPKSPEVFHAEIQLIVQQARTAADFNKGIDITTLNVPSIDEVRELLVLGEVELITGITTFDLLKVRDFLAQRGEKIVFRGGRHAPIDTLEIIRQARLAAQTNHTIDLSPLNIPQAEEDLDMRGSRFTALDALVDLSTLSGFSIPELEGLIRNYDISIQKMRDTASRQAERGTVRYQRILLRQLYSRAKYEKVTLHPRVIACAQKKKVYREDSEGFLPVELYPPRRRHLHAPRVAASKARRALEASERAQRALEARARASDPSSGGASSRSSSPRAADSSSRSGSSSPAPAAAGIAAPATSREPSHPPSPEPVPAAVSQDSVSLRTATGDVAATVSFAPEEEHGDLFGSSAAASPAGFPLGAGLTPEDPRVVRAMGGVPTPAAPRGISASPIPLALSTPGSASASPAAPGDFDSGWRRRVVPPPFELSGLGGGDGDGNDSESGALAHDGDESSVSLPSLAKSSLSLPDVIDEGDESEISLDDVREPATPERSTLDNILDGLGNSAGPGLSPLGDDDQARADMQKWLRGAAASTLTSPASAPGPQARPLTIEDLSYSPWPPRHGASLDTGLRRGREVSVDLFGARKAPPSPGGGSGELSLDELRKSGETSLDSVKGGSEVSLPPVDGSEEILLPEVRLGVDGAGDQSSLSHDELAQNAHRNDDSLSLPSVGGRESLGSSPLRASTGSMGRPRLMAAPSPAAARESSGAGRDEESLVSLDSLS